MSRRHAPHTILPSAILILAACAGAKTGADRPTAMTPSVTSRSAAAPSTHLAASAPITVEAGRNTLVIEQVRLVLGEIELELSDADCSGSGSDNSGPVSASSGSGTCFASWFRGGGGTVLDPSSPANAFQIGQDIRQSFAAFEDDDRNGLEDHRR